MRNYILYIAYGSINNINECKYSLLKYIDKYSAELSHNTSIVIYTDQPHVFKLFTSFNSNITITEVSLDQIKEWRGDDDFVFRTKIKVIQDFFSTHTGNLLYCDTDTYALSSLQPIFSSIEQGNFFMHLFEGKLGGDNNYFKKWNNFFAKNPIEYNGKKMEYSPEIQMWNAGVLGFNSQNSDLLHDVLSLSDTIYKKFPKHIAEQFAFGYCLQKKGTINTSADVIIHYWDLKEFRIVLEKFFEKYKDLTLAELITKTSQLHIIAAQQDKERFKNLSWSKKLSNKIQGKKFKINNYLNF
jgi:hypothetical protein